MTPLIRRTWATHALSTHPFHHSSFLHQHNKTKSSNKTETHPKEKGQIPSHVHRGRKSVPRQSEEGPKRQTRKEDSTNREDTQYPLSMRLRYKERVDRSREAQEAIEERSGIRQRERRVQREGEGVLEGKRLTFKLKELMQQKKFQEVEHLFRDACRAGTAGIFHWNQMIHFLGKKRHIQRSIELYEEMQSRGIQPDVTTFTTLISIFGKNGDMQRSIKSFEEMQSRGIQPDVTTFNTLIDIFGKSGDIQRSIELYEEMQSRGIQPDVTTFTTLIEAFGRGNKIEQSLKLFEEVRERLTPENVTLSTILDACGHNGEMTKAYSIWKEWDNKLDSSLPPKNINNFTSMIEACGRNHHVSQAYLVFDEMESEGVQPNWKFCSTFATVVLVHNGLVEYQGIKKWKRYNNTEKVEDVLSSEELEEFKLFISKLRR